jgi:hypothetical protein
VESPGAIGLGQVRQWVSDVVAGNGFGGPLFAIIAATVFRRLAN